MATLNRPAGETGLLTHEGAPAKRIDLVQQLRRTVMACLLWERNFYEDGQSVADRIKDLVSQIPLEESAKIACEARSAQHLRHVPLLIVREMARMGGPRVANTLATVIQRADELTEFLAIYWADGKEPLSAQVKLGLATNPKVMIPTALKFLNFLQERDLRNIMKSKDVASPVATHARRILQKKGKV